MIVSAIHEGAGSIFGAEYKGIGTGSRNGDIQDDRYIGLKFKFGALGYHLRV